MEEEKSGEKPGENSEEKPAKGRKSMARKSLARKSLARKSLARKSLAGKRKSTTGRKSITSRKSSDGSVKRDDSKRALRNKPKVRTKAVLNTPFKQVWLTVSEIRPFLLLLRSQERSLILRACDYLYEFLRCNPQEIDMFFESTYMEDIKELTAVEEKFIPESAFRLLAELSLNPRSHKYLVEDPIYMEYLYSKYTGAPRDIDSKITEHVTRIFSEVTTSARVVQEIFENIKGLSSPKIFATLSSSYPDTVYNTLVLIGNIFKDLPTAEILLNDKAFKFNILFNLLASDFVEVQHKALNLIHWLVCQPKTELLKDMFLAEGGASEMFNVLSKFQWRDLHEEALSVLNAALRDDEQRIRGIGSMGVEKLYEYIEFCEDDVLIAKVLQNLLNVSATVFGKQELISLGIVDKIVEFLTDGTPEMKLGACNIMVELLKSTVTIPLFTELTPVSQLLDIITDPDHNWELASAALRAMHNLLKISLDMTNLLLKPELREQLKSWIIRVLPTMPKDTKNVLYNLLSGIVQHSMIRSYIVDLPLVWAFLLPLRDNAEGTTSIQLVAAEALYYLIPYAEPICQFILASGGVDIISKALREAIDTKLISMLCHVIRAAVESDKAITVAFLRNQSLKCFLPEMEMAVMTLLNNFLPAKYEYFGRLNLHDIVQDQFYLRREYDDPSLLPIPPNVVDTVESPDYTIFTCNLTRPTPVGPKEEAEQSRSHEELMSKCALTFNMELDVEKKGIECDLTQNSDYKSALAANTVQLPEDEYLCHYLEEAKQKLKKIDEEIGIREFSRPFDHSWVLDRIRVISDIVTAAFSLSGHKHSMKHYLIEVKDELKSNLIPIGYLECGTSVEKALMFKVLADQLDLPATLWRGAHGNAWNEVALINLGEGFPRRNKNETKVTTEDKPEMPTRLMYPTHVVDLTEVPGRLLELGSADALHYTGRPIESVLSKVNESAPPALAACLVRPPHPDDDQKPNK